MSSCLYLMSSSTIRHEVKIIIMKQDSTLIVGKHQPLYIGCDHDSMGGTQKTDSGTSPRVGLLKWYTCEFIFPLALLSGTDEWQPNDRSYDDHDLALEHDLWKFALVESQQGPHSIMHLATVIYSKHNSPQKTEPPELLRPEALSRRSTMDFFGN